MGDRLLTVPVFLAVVTGAGVVYAYLRWTSGSLWPVIIAHGTFNAVLGVVSDASSAARPTAAAYLTAETGILTLACVVVAAVVLARSLQRSSAPVRGHVASRKPAAP